jgi:hypothetical protein
MTVMFVVLLRALLFSPVPLTTPLIADADMHPHRRCGHHPFLQAGTKVSASEQRQKSAQKVSV